MNDPAGLRTGARFGPYELRSLLGKGGMGEVYEAYDTVKDRVVAVKLLPRHLAGDPTYQERFRRESHAAARLREPHVVPIHDWGEIDGVLYIDMRLVQGRTLRELLTADGAVEPERTVAIVEQVAAALDAAHADGLVHRDIKPENVIVTPDDFAYLLDFGIAHSATDPTLTTLGSAIGSYAYMAPERFDDQPVTPRADVYSLACVLAELLTGKRPFEAATVSQAIRAHLHAPPPRPSLLRKDFPTGLDDVVAHGMAKDPAQRYATAGELARAARAALAPAHRMPPPTAQPAIDPTRVGSFGETPAYEPTMVRPVDGYGSVPDIAARTAPPVPDYRSPMYPPPAAPPRRSAVVPVAITLLVVLLLALGGVVGWLVLHQRSDGSTGTPSTVTAHDAAQSVAAGPPTGSQTCGSVFGRTGQFTGSAVGSSVTSCPFAEEVRRAYAASGPAAAQPRQVLAASPVTGLTYTMTCSANGGLVTCTGGDNAVVYVY